MLLSSLRAVLAARPGSARRGSARSRLAYAPSRATSRYWVLTTLPFASTRKHSVIAFPLLRALRDWEPVDLQVSCSSACGVGGASAVLGATFAHTACIIGSKMGTAMLPPVDPPPRV